MIAQAHQSSGGSNKGSVSNLIDYLEKENDSIKDGGFFFGRTKEKDSFDEKITRTQAVRAIDENTKGLRKTDTKFFMLTVNFSEKEQKHIANKIAGKEVKNIDELTTKQRNLYEQKLRNYTKGVMDIYAKNFNKGLTEKDMIYVSKIEHERTYKGTDKAVQEGQKKSGQKKEGFQTHIHIVVSRKDASQQVSLSPNAKERIAKNNHVLNGKNVTKGFNHETFKIKTEQLFDQQFSHNRKYHESYASKSKNPALESITRAYKRQLTPKQYKEMSSLSKQNTSIVLKYFTKPKESLLQTLKTNIKDQLSVKEQFSDQMTKII